MRPSAREDNLMSHRQPEQLNNAHRSRRSHRAGIYAGGYPGANSAQPQEPHQQSVYGRTGVANRAPATDPGTGTRAGAAGSRSRASPPEPQPERVHMLPPRTATQAASRREPASAVASPRRKPPRQPKSAPVQIAAASPKPEPEAPPHAAAGRCQAAQRLGLVPAARPLLTVSATSDADAAAARCYAQFFRLAGLCRS